MLSTSLCELIEIRYPILQGAMGPNDTSDLAIAVCQAGGLGVISSVHSPDLYTETRRHIQKVKDRTDSPFAVNQVIKATDASERIRAVLDERKADPEVRRRLRAVITSGGDPKVFAGALKESGVLHIHVVPTVDYALKAVAAGCDAIIAEGYESGGHVAYQPVHSLVLIPAVVDAVRVPVIAAGGFCDGRGLVAALALGAAGIQMATRFYLSREAAFARPEIQQALLEARVVDTLVVPGTYGPNRHWRNPYAEHLHAIEVAGVPDEEIKRVKNEGETARGRGERERAAVPIGMVIGRISELESVHDIIERTMQEAGQIVSSLHKQDLKPVA